MWLDRGSGAKCYMLLARGLHISWGDTPCYWRWMDLPDSRFKVAQLLNVCWFEIRGKIHSKMLSRDTAYAVYIVFKTPVESYGLDYPPQKASIDTVAGKKIIRKVCLQSYKGRHVNRWVTMRLTREYKSYRRGHGRNPVLPQERADGWMELEMGVFYNKVSDDGEVRFSLLQTSPTSKRGLIVQGIEIRPKKLG
ncbi:F-box protein PP2-B10-like isoform X2 [Panicum virgatum]|nr:F-box protein PP2-B10-like isoform X2 [Panicum virgatum]